MNPSDKTETGVSRREFLQVTGGLLGGAGIYVFLLNARGSTLTSLAAGASQDDYDPREHTWGFAIDSHKCIGCGRCVVACKLENKVPPRPTCNRTWVERYQITKDGRTIVDSPNSGMYGFVGLDGDGRDANIEKGFFVPKLCNQCDNSPCFQVCPVSATYIVADGIVMVDQERCIGCRYCIMACPYGARYLVPPDAEISPTGQTSVVDKCTWCYHRITKGDQPACVEACPVGARVFGDLLDPDSPVRRIMREQRVTVLKPELGTKPKCYYVGLEEGVR